MNSVTPGNDPLIRTLGVRELTAATINMIVGAGIFLLPAEVASLAGHRSTLAFLACGLAVGLFMVCFSMAGSRVSLSGGPYACIRFAFGPEVGFVAGFVFWVANVLGAAAVANGLLGALQPLMPRLGIPLIRIAVLALVLAGLALLNIRGVRQGAFWIEGVTVAKLVPLLVFVGVGYFRNLPGEITGPTIPESSNIGAAALALFFAFIGAEGALQASGEVRQPARTVPRALLASTALITLLYLGIQSTVQSVLGARNLGHSEAPLTEGAAILLGWPGQAMMAAGLVMASLGVVSGDMLATPRTLYAFAQDRFAPSALARVHPRFHTPHVAIAVHGLLVFGLAASGRFEQLARLCTVMMLLVYGLCCLAAWQLDRQDVREAGEPFRPSGAAVIPWLSCLIVGWLIAQATAADFLLTAATVGISLLLILSHRLKAGLAIPAYPASSPAPGSKMKRGART